MHGRSFPFQKLIPKRPGAYTRWGVLSQFYGIYKTNMVLLKPRMTKLFTVTN